MITFSKERIVSLREKAGLTPSEFARELGISRQLQHQYENGISRPGVKILARVCNTFGVDPNYFFGKEA